MKNNKNIYDDYIKTKGWRIRFQHSVADGRLFEYEFSVPLSDASLKRVIDVGFGAGTLMSWARNRGIEVCGIEVQDTLVQEARDLGYVIHDRLVDIAKGSLDMAVCMDVVEHMTVDEMRDAFLEFRRILRPGGWLVIRTPNCQSPAGLIDQFGDATHRQMLSGPILSQELRRFGFDVEVARGAMNRAAFIPGGRAFVRRVLKNVLAKPARSIVRLGLGLGSCILEPSILVVSRRSQG